MNKKKCLKYDPVCVVELLLHEEKCSYENDEFSVFESLKNMYIWACMCYFKFVIQLQPKNSAPNVPVRIQTSVKHCSGLISANFIRDPQF